MKQIFILKFIYYHFLVLFKWSKFQSPKARKIYVWRMNEYTKVVVRSRKSKDRKYNCQMKTDNSTNNDLLNTTQKTRDWATSTTHTKLGWSQILQRVRNSFSTIGTRRNYCCEIYGYYFRDMSRLVFCSLLMLCCHCIQLDVLILF